MSWFNNREKHSQAAHGIKTKYISDNRLSNPVIVTWLQEDKNGNKIKLSKEFSTPKKAQEHIERLKMSAYNINKPIKILSIKEK